MIFQPFYTQTGREKQLFQCFCQKPENIADGFYQEGSYRILVNAGACGGSQNFADPKFSLDMTYQIVKKKKTSA